MVESQIKLSERLLINNPNIKTKSELELKADLIKEIEEQIKSLDHTGNGFGILVSNITGFVSGYNFLLNDYKKLLEQAKTSQLTYKQLNDQYLALGNRLSGVAETSDTWALGSQVVKSTTETASVLAGEAIGGVAGRTAAGTLTSGLNSLAGNATSASIGGDTFDPKKVGIETGQGFVKSAITAVSFKVGEVSGAASASALVKALPANSISPKILNLVGGTVGGFAGGGFGNGAGQINEMVMSKFGLGNKKEFDWDSFRLSLGFGGLGGAMGSQFGHSVPAVIADGLTGAGLGLGELAANNGGSLQGISREEFANTIAQNLVNPFIGKAVAHHNYSNPQNLIKSPEAVSELKEENTKELLKIANEHTLNNNPEKYIEFMTNFVKNATDEQLDSVSYNHFEEFFSKLANNKLSESTINKTFELLELCSLREKYFVEKIIDSLFENKNAAWEQLVKYNPDKAFGALNTIASKHGSQERVLIYQFTNHLDNYRFVGYAVKDKLSPQVKAEIVLTLSSRDFSFYHYHYYDDKTIKYITKTLFEYGVLKQNKNNKYFEALKEFIGENYSSNSYYRERKNYLQEIILKTPTEEIKNKEILDLFANDFIYSSLDINLYSKLVEIDPSRVLKEFYDYNFDKNLQYTHKKEIREIAVEIALKNTKEEYAQKIISETIFDDYLKRAKPDENNRFAKLIENCSSENLWNLVLDNVYNIRKTYLFKEELISKLEDNIETLKIEKDDWRLENIFSRFQASKLTEEENLKIKSLKEKLAEKTINTENINQNILRSLICNCPESRDLILVKHFNSFDNNTLKYLISNLLFETNENNFEQNKIFLQKIINHLGKEEVLNILLERRKYTAERIHNLETIFIDKVIFELGLGNNEFFKLIKLELSKSIISYSHDNNWKQHVDNFFNILMSESKGIYLKDLFIDKYIDYRERDNTIKILENNISSLDYLKPEDFDPANLTDEQSQILYNNFKHIYKQTKSTELISKLQPLTEKLFVKYNPDLLEEAKTHVVETMRNDDYSILNKAFPELEETVKNGLEQCSINDPNSFFALFSDDFKTYQSTGLNDFIKSLLIKVIKNSSDKLIGNQSPSLDLSNMTITEDLKIQGLPKLGRIDLPNAKLPEDFTLENLPNLRRINLSNAEITQGFKLENLPNLERINLSKAKIPEGFKIENLPNLERIDLSNAEIPEGFTLENLPNLERIDLSNAKIPEGFTLENLPNLIKINLSNAEIIPKGFKLENLPNLKTIDLSNAKLPEGFTLENLPNLEKINLSKAKIPEGFTLENLPNLERINLFKAEIIPKGFKLENLPNLKSIDLTNVNLEGVNLNNINLTNANLTNTNLQSSNLENVDFTQIKLMPENFNIFIGANLQNTNFSNLNLAYDFSDCNLTGANFEGSNLANSKFSKNIKNEVIWNDKTIWPIATTNQVFVEPLIEPKTIQNFAGYRIIQTENDKYIQISNSEIKISFMPRISGTQIASQVEKVQSLFPDRQVAVIGVSGAGFLSSDNRLGYIIIKGEEQPIVNNLSPWVSGGFMTMNNGEVKLLNLENIEIPKEIANKDSWLMDERKRLIKEVLDTNPDIVSISLLGRVYSDSSKFFETYCVDHCYMLFDKNNNLISMGFNQHSVHENELLSLQQKVWGDGISLLKLDASNYNNSSLFGGKDTLTFKNGILTLLVLPNEKNDQENKNSQIGQTLPEYSLSLTKTDEVIIAMKEFVDTVSQGLDILRNQGAGAFWNKLQKNKYYLCIKNLFQIKKF
jgi:uncharacterized protein YjbI with pentapeptide repeats